MSNVSYISGNVGKDPEIRETQNGTKVAMFSLAAYRANPKDKEKPLTDWYNVVAWGDQADLVTSNVKKGTKIMAVGRFQTRTYEGKDGKTNYVTELILNEFYLAPAKEKKDDNAGVIGDIDSLPF